MHRLHANTIVVVVVFRVARAFVCESIVPIANEHWANCYRVRFSVWYSVCMYRFCRRRYNCSVVRIDEVNNRLGVENVCVFSVRCDDEAMRKCISLIFIET